jgi:hypothetical protein
MTAEEHEFEQLRPPSFAIAYRMLGSVSEAEDVVQEALLRVHQALERSRPPLQRAPARGPGGGDRDDQRVQSRQCRHPADHR